MFPLTKWKPSLLPWSDLVRRVRTPSTHESSVNQRVFWQAHWANFSESSGEALPQLPHMTSRHWLKVLESIVRDHLLHHFSSAGMFHDAQHGILPGRSCSSQLIEAMEDWSAAVEDWDPLDVVYLDFAKAFDSVPHLRLLSKLRAYGVRGRLLDWIEAFLIGRRQRVVVQGSKSSLGSLSRVAYRKVPF